MQRRSLEFRDADAVIAEIRHLQESGYSILGKWNLAQMCEHLSGTLRIGLDGGNGRMPWALRKLVGEPMVRRIIRTRRMMSGVPAPKEIIPKASGDMDDPSAIDDCITLLERARDAAGPLPPHPLGDMSVDEWKQLNWVHCAHHLSFLVPKKRDGSTDQPEATSFRQPA
jgi:hypothetical protein